MEVLLGTLFLFVILLAVGAALLSIVDAFRSPAPSSAQDSEAAVTETVSFHTGKYLTGLQGCATQVGGVVCTVTRDYFVFTGSDSILGSIPRDAVNQVIVDDRTSISRQISLGRVLLFGPLALAAPVKKQEQAYWLVIDWENEAGVQCHTVFEFTGFLCSDLANSAANGLLARVQRKTQRLAADEVKCPQCAETIKREAKICRFCRLPVNLPVPEAKYADQQQERSQEDQVGTRLRDLSNSESDQVEPEARGDEEPTEQHEPVARSNWLLQVMAAVAVGSVALAAYVGLQIADPSPTTRPAEAAVARLASRPATAKRAPLSPRYRIGYRTEVGDGSSLLTLDHTTWAEIARATDQGDIRTAISLTRGAVDSGRAFWVMPGTGLQVIDVNRREPSVRVKVLSGEHRGRAGWVFGVYE